MKTKILFLVLFLTALGLRAQIPGLPGTPGGVPVTTSPAAPPADPSAGTNEVAGYEYNFPGMDMNQVLDIYAGLVGRTILRAGPIPGSFILHTQSPLTKHEAIEAFEAVFALNGVSIVNIGDKFMKVVPSTDAGAMGGKNSSTDAADLPELGSFVTQIVPLKYTKPSEMVAVLTPFAKLAPPLALDSNGLLIIRDYAENVKRMMEMIARVDVYVPAEYISEVIPIKYAKADDIASALNSLGGTGGGGTVSIGGSSGATTGANGVRPVSTTTGIGGTTGYNGAASQPRTANGLGVAQPATPNGTPSATSFQNQLQRIIARASGTGGGQDQIQVFGQTKIIADTRSNSLLIFATRQDMDAITNIIAKLDVLLSQVLIESVIMEVSLGHNWNLGVSAVQRPQQFNDSSVVGGGIMNNGNGSFLDVVKRLSTNGVSRLSGTFPTNSGSGLSYFANINQNFDVAVQAAESDSSTTIIQKPRIQTFQAQPATFFVGSTVPYVTSTYNGGTTGIGSSFAQLSVGVSLVVTPFINPDGLVVMQIDEEIDSLDGSTEIVGVGLVPNTSKKTLSSNVAVKDHDSIILGGAITSSKISNKSGVPILQNIPLLGALFSQRSSDKSRQELLVLIRPTVLKTPEIAAQQAKVEEARLPGIHSLEAQDNKDEAKTVAGEQKRQRLQDEQEAKDAAKANAKEQKSGKTNSIPAAVTPDSTSTSPDAIPTNGVPTTSAAPAVPTTSAPKSVPAADPVAGLH